ncbi:MAG: hypothetical protein RR740_08955 [Pseudomonas sp.]
MGWITQKQFAAIVGVSAPAVCNSLKRGRLAGATRTTDTGRVEIDQELGEKLWHQNNGRPDLAGQKTGARGPAQVPQESAPTEKPQKTKAAPEKKGKVGPAGTKKMKAQPGTKEKAKAQTAKGEVHPPKKALPGADVAEYDLPDPFVSRRRAEHFKALQAELDYRVEAKEYVLVEDVAKQVEEEYTAISKRLRAIKITLAPELCDLFGDADMVQVQELIDQHINEALNELSDPHALTATTAITSGSTATA